MNIAYELIGTMPALDVFRDTLPTLFAEYEALRPKIEADKRELLAIFESGGHDAVQDYMLKRMQDPEATRRVTIGVTISLCAQHFYGIDTTDMLVPEIIDAIKATDNELENGK